MQYTGRLQIAKGNPQKPPSNRMRHVYPPALRLSAVLLVLGLSACAGGMEDSPLSSTELQRQYDKTLTKTEQQAVISDLQGATAKKEGEGDTGEENDPATESDNTN
jgi:hypothetical protein